MNEPNTLPIENMRPISFAIIKDLCKRWLDIEKKLYHGVYTDMNADLTIYYSISSLSLFNMKELDILLDIRNEEIKTITRLFQLYMHCTLILGKKEMDEIENDIISLLKEFKLDKQYKKYKKKYPFIVLLPILNEVLKDTTI